MADADLKYFAQDLISAGRMSEDDLLRFRRMTGKDFEISDGEANLLFEVNDAVETPEGWTEYFVNAISSYVLYQTAPQGYVTDENAAWLRARIDHDGVVETETELHLLLSLLKNAHNVTNDIEKFTLDQVGAAVRSGTGYIGKNRQLKPGVIGEAEIHILRRVLYSVSGDQGISISQTEAEFIFDLNEETLAAENHTDWQDLFVKAIANHLMMNTAYNEPSREEALRQENWLESPTNAITIGSLFKSIFDKNHRKSLLNAETDMQNTLEHGSMFTDEVAIANAEKVTDLEATWLIERLNRDGQLDANEKALLDFLKQECPDIHASLTPLLNAA